MSKRDSFIFYRSFFEATKPLKKNEKAELFQAICDYALDQKEGDLSALPEAMFALIQPQLQANYKKYLNGKKPKEKKSKTEAKTKQTVSKTEGNVNDNDNENVNKNDNVNDIVYTKDVYDCLESCLVYFPEQLQPDNFDTWIDTVDKLHRIDNVPYETILKITRWGREDAFWCKNFLTLPKLRTKNKEKLPYHIVFSEGMKTKTLRPEHNVASEIDLHEKF